MERGDIGQHVTQRSVIVLVPTLAIPPVTTWRKKWQGLRTRAVSAAWDAEINMGMASWMESQAYMFSETFEVWHVAPLVDYERLLFEQLTERLEPYVQRSVSSWQHYDAVAAKHVALSTPEIVTVYDADEPRLRVCWPHRGYRVPFGRHP